LERLTLHPKEAKGLSNRDLIDRLVAADPEDSIWPEFVARFQNRIRLAVLRCFQAESRRNPGLDTGLPQDAVVDLTQEVFVKLLESDRRALSRFRGRSEHSIYTYLNTISVNLVRDHFKKLRAQKTPRASASLSNVIQPASEGGGPSYHEALMSDGPGPERFVASSELRARMAAAVAEAAPRSSSAPRDRLVFRLYFIEGLTVGEIARIGSIGLSTSGVEKCVRRIRDALRESLSATASPEGGKGTPISSYTMEGKD
jgi:RNA polymerase sigma factor (sigma-70 family)